MWIKWKFCITIRKIFLSEKLGLHCRLKVFKNLARTTAYVVILKRCQTYIAPWNGGHHSSNFWKRIWKKLSECIYFVKKFNERKLTVENPKPNETSMYDSIFSNFNRLSKLSLCYINKYIRLKCWHYLRAFMKFIDTGENIVLTSMIYNWKLLVCYILL